MRKLAQKKQIFISLFIAMCFMTACSGSNEKTPSTADVDSESSYEVAGQTEESSTAEVTTEEQSTEESSTEVKPTEEMETQEETEPASSTELPTPEATETPVPTEESIGEPPEIANPVEIVKFGTTYTVPDWYLGQLLNGEELGKEYSVFCHSYDYREDVLFLPDTAMNDETGGIKKAEKQITELPESEEIDAAACFEGLDIRGKAVSVSLCQPDVKNTVYADALGRFLVIDGITYDMQNDWDFYTGYEEFRPEWLRVWHRNIFLVDIDTSDSMVELIMQTAHKTVLMRYDGIKLYQIAALYEGWDQNISFEGHRNGTVHAYAGMDTFIETASVWWELTLEDGKLYQRPGSEEVNLVLHSEEIQGDPNYNLRSLETLMLSETPDHTAEKTVELKAQEIDCLKVKQEDYGHEIKTWVYIRGREDGTEGWIFEDDVDDVYEIFAGMFRAG